MRRTWLVVVLVGAAAAAVMGADAAPTSATASTTASATGAEPSAVLQWTALPDLPNPLGVAGAVAGTSGKALIVAGGANFPDKPPWDAGVKAWHDRIYVLPSPDGAWQELPERLPQPLAYGVSAQAERGVVSAGGSSAAGHTAAVFLLEWIDGRLRRTDLPPLPAPCANACGAVLDGVLYVAGGTERPDSTEAGRNFWALDLGKPDAAWRTLDPWPGDGRILAVAGVQDKSFFLFSGARLHAGPDGKPAREFLRDAYRYRPGAGWARLADLPRAAVAAPSPAAALGQSHLAVLGGDDGRLFGQDLRERHPGFCRDVLAYHTITDTWAVLGEMALPPSLRGGYPDLPRVTAPLVRWGKDWVLPSGEVRPGVRSPAVSLATANTVRAGFGWINYATIVVYLAGMVAIGFYFGAKKKGTNDFFRGGQRIPWWAAGLSIFATLLSSLTFMAIPAKAYATDWTYAVQYVAIFALTPLIIIAYLPFYRQLNVTSAYEYLELRFNLPVRWFAAVVFIVFQVGRMAIVLFLPAIALATVSSVDVYACILVMGVLCVLYTVTGGMEAVVWTDVIQSVVLLAGAGVSLAIILARCDGGPVAALDVAHAGGKFFESSSWTLDTSTATIWVVLVGAFFSNLAPYTASQDVVQRYVTTKDQRRAAKAIWTNAAVSLPAGLLFFAVGTALYVFYKTHPERLDPTLPTDSIFPQFLVRELPVGVAGLVVAGIFAAAQSTLAGSLNSVATVWVTDFHKRLRRNTDDRADLRLAQGVTILLGLVATGVALVMATYDIVSLWDSFLKILGLAGGALAGLFALGIFTRRANGAGALVGALASVGVLYYVQQYTRTNFWLYGLVGVGVCFIVGYAASLVLPGRKKSLEGLTIYTVKR